MSGPGETIRIEEFTTPYPPRYRWLKRSFLIVGIVLVLLAGLRIWWGWYAHRCLQAEIDAIHARGEPILPEDFQQPPIPDADNAAWYLRQAAAAIKSHQVIDEADTDALWMTAPIGNIAAYMADEQAALRYARLARQHKQINWNIKWSGFSTRFPDLHSQRELAHLLGVAAAVEHRQAKDAEAIQSVRDLHRVADAMNQFSPPTLVSHLVGVGIDAVTTDGAMLLSYVLQLSGSNTAEGRQISEMIHDLSDERQYQLAGVQCWYGERLLPLDILQTPQWGLLLSPPSVEEKFVHPMYELDVVQFLDEETQVAEACKQATWPAVRGKLPARVSLNSHGMAFQASRFLSSMIRPSERAILMHFRELAERRGAAVALAIRLYRADHGDQWPATLEELVPRYIAAVPVDPFSPTAATLRYKRDAAGGPILYSVSEDGVDNSGSEQPIATRRSFPINRWETLDAVFHLVYQPPATEPGDSP